MTISRREFVVRAASLTAVASFAPFTGEAGASERIGGDPTDERPNIIVIMDDDLNTRSMRELPEITDLLGGTRFSRAFVSVSLCGPSRVSYFRGQYAHNHRITDNPGACEQMKRIDDEMLAVWLKRRGYTNALFGKYGNGCQDTGYVPPGWDEFDCMLGKFEERRMSSSPQEGSVRRHTTELYSSLARDFIGRQDGPFMCWIGVNAPHSPPEVAPEYAREFSDTPLPGGGNFNSYGQREPDWLAKKDRLDARDIERMTKHNRQRLRSMLSVRDLIRELKDTLRESGQDAYIFFTSDNGYHLGNHRLIEGKVTHYEEDVKVPLHVSGPDVKADAVRDELITNNDLAPTICDLAGANHPDWVDGRSFAPLLRGEFVPWRRYIGIEGFEIKARSPTIPDIPARFGLRSDDEKFIRYSTGETEWFRLHSDPAEKINRKRSSDPRTFDRLQARARRIHDSSGPNCRTAED